MIELKNRMYTKKALLKEDFKDELFLKIRAWEVKKSPRDLGYVFVKDWPKLPKGWELSEYVSGVASDSKGRYYIFQRGKKAPPLMCFDRDGELLSSWGEDLFLIPHMAKCDKNDNIWLVDREHFLNLCSPNGEILKTLGTKGVPGEDDSHFDMPTDITFGRDGLLYISDGYGNSRIAVFDRDLNFVKQWGTMGVGKGQFLNPHAITTDIDGLIYVADRPNWRVSIFTPEGEFLKEWTHLGKPIGIVYAPDGFIYVSEVTTCRTYKVDTEGNIIGWFGELGEGPGQTSWLHAITVSKNGDILLAHGYGKTQGRAQLFRRE
jgi:DNA-binding beta-propeller fold protein YncE